MICEYSRDRLCHGLKLGHGWRVMQVTGHLNNGSRVTKCDHCQLWAEWLEIAQWLRITMESLSETTIALLNDTIDDPMISPQIGVPNAPLIISNFKCPYLRNGSSDPLHVCSRVVFFGVRARWIEWRYFRFYWIQDGRRHDATWHEWHDGRYQQKPSDVTFCQINLALVHVLMC